MQSLSAQHPPIGSVVELGATGDVTVFHQYPGVSRVTPDRMDGGRPLATPAGLVRIETRNLYLGQGFSEQSPGGKAPGSIPKRTLQHRIHREIRPEELFRDHRLPFPTLQPILCLLVGSRYHPALIDGILRGHVALEFEPADPETIRRTGAIGAKPNQFGPEIHAARIGAGNRENPSAIGGNGRKALGLQIEAARQELKSHFSRSWPRQKSQHGCAQKWKNPICGNMHNGGN